MSLVKTQGMSAGARTRRVLCEGLPAELVAGHARATLSTLIDASVRGVGPDCGTERRCDGDEHCPRDPDGVAMRPPGNKYQSQQRHAHCTAGTSVSSVCQ
jgi:hypothetical protein